MLLEASTLKSSQIKFTFFVITLYSFKIVESNLPLTLSNLNSFCKLSLN